jgi:pimeloyl-ACP methyl ester carboxylesterase
LEEFLWDFTQLVHQLKVEEPFTLMAHSFGGPLAITFTQGRLEAIDKLVLVASSPDMRLETWIEMILKSPISLSVLERLRPILLPKTFAPLFVIQKVTAGSLFRWRGWDLLPLIKKPTLIVGGQFDHIVRTKSLEKMHKLIPNSRLEIIRYTRHLPHLERPAAVNRVIDGFLGQRRNWRDAPTEGMAG